MTFFDTKYRLSLYLRTFNVIYYLFFLHFYTMNSNITIVNHADNNNDSAQYAFYYLYNLL